MSSNKRVCVASALLMSAIISYFCLPMAKYAGQDIIPQLNIPLKVNHWHGRGVEQEWMEGREYNFIGQILHREYVNMDGQSLYLLVLEGGNFHNPKVCSYGAGFKVQELNDYEFRISDRVFKAHSLYLEHVTGGFLTIYWICVDKDIADWTGHKARQLWYSLINKKRASLMLRLDIPCKKDHMDAGFRLADKFMTDLCQTIAPDHMDYIFGKAGRS